MRLCLHMACTVCCELWKAIWMCLDIYFFLGAQKKITFFFSLQMSEYTMVTADDGTKICVSKWSKFDRVCKNCHADRATEPRVSEACVDCCQSVHLVGLCAFGCELSKTPFLIGGCGGTWCNCGDHYDYTEESKFDVYLVNTGVTLTGLSVGNMSAERLINMHCENLKLDHPLLKPCSEYGRPNLPSEYLPATVFPTTGERVQDWVTRVSGTHVKETLLMSHVMPGFPVLDSSTTTLDDICRGRGVKTASTKPNDWLLVYKGKPIPSPQYVWSVTDRGVYDLNFDLWSTKEWLERDQHQEQVEAVPITPVVVSKKRERDTCVLAQLPHDPVKWFEHFGLDSKQAVVGACFNVEPNNVIFCVLAGAKKKYEVYAYKNGRQFVCSGHTGNRTHGVLLTFDSVEERAEFCRLVEQLKAAEFNPRQRSRLFGLLGVEFLMKEPLSFLVEQENLLNASPAAEAEAEEEEVALENDFSLSSFSSSPKRPHVSTPLEEEISFS